MKYRTPATPARDVIPVRDQPWRQHGACRGLDADIFYPTADDEATAAKSICADCPVRQPCLECALANRERDGVWGGATEKERRRMIRQRRRTA